MIFVKIVYIYIESGPHGKRCLWEGLHIKVVDKGKQAVGVEGKHTGFAGENILHNRVACNGKDIVQVFKAGADKTAFKGNPVFVTAGQMWHNFDAHFPFDFGRHHYTVCTGTSQRRVCNCDDVHTCFLQFEAC